MYFQEKNWLINWSTYQWIICLSKAVDMRWWLRFDANEVHVIMFYENDMKKLLIYKEAPKMVLGTGEQIIPSQNEQKQKI